VDQVSDRYGSLEKWTRSVIGMGAWKSALWDEARGVRYL
jgi:hypothetical protein